MQPPAPDPTAADSPVSAAGGNPLPVVPPMQGAGTPPATPPPPIIDKASNIPQQRQAADQISNPIERTATLFVDAVQDHAKRLASSLSEQPADTVEGDPQTVHEMMTYSPYGVDAARAFWKTHDDILQQATQAGDPDPYAAAERGALDEVFPYRAKLALLDVLGPDEKVKRAEQLMDVSHRQIAKGQTPESMPFMVGPQALKPDEATMPQSPPSTNGKTGGPY